MRFGQWNYSLHACPNIKPSIRKRHEIPQTLYGQLLLFHSAAEQLLHKVSCAEEKQSFDFSFSSWPIRISPFFCRTTSLALPVYHGLSSKGDQDQSPNRINPESLRQTLLLVLLSLVIGRMWAVAVFFAAGLFISVS